MSIPESPTPLPDNFVSTTTAERGGAGSAFSRSVISAAKEAVSIMELAERLCGSLSHVGGKPTGHCPMPDHEDRTPSFVVFEHSNRFKCFGCQRGGDVVDLAQLAWGIDRLDVAAAEVLLTFGHEPPQRPGSWSRKQQRQKPMRDAVEEARIRSLQRRIYRVLLQEILVMAEMEDRAAEEEALWRDARRIAVCIRSGRGW